MKKYLLFILTAMIMITAACASAGKMIASGHYDAAIEKSVKKLGKNRGKEKQIRYLRAAYTKAQQRDLDRISFLKKEGKPENAVEIMNLYSNIDYRQDLVQRVLPLYLNGSQVQFTLINVDEELIAYKEEAAGYLYSHAEKLLAQNNKQSAREAYYELLQVRDIYRDYRDVDQLINRAYNKGVNLVLFEVQNASHNVVPKEFYQELYAQNFADLESFWYKIIPNTENENRSFDYAIKVKIQQVEIGPEQVKERSFVEVKEVQNGWEYLKDSKGNVMKDSLGNDIKVVKYKEISCQVIETHQLKVADFRGSIAIVDLRQNRQLKNEAFATTAVFENFALIPAGNLDALTNETRDKLGGKIIPFPDNYQMLMDGSHQLKPTIRNVIRHNRNFLERPA